MKAHITNTQKIYEVYEEFYDFCKILLNVDYISCSLTENLTMAFFKNSDEYVNSMLECLEWEYSNCFGENFKSIFNEKSIDELLKIFNEMKDMVLKNIVLGKVLENGGAFGIFYNP